MTTAERLREWSDKQDDHETMFWLNEGADELEALTKERDRLRDALVNISEYWNGNEGSAAFDAAQHCSDLAEAALKGETKWPPPTKH